VVEFLALPVPEGDAFVVRDERRTYLVDGGGRTALSGLESLPVRLHNIGVNRLGVAACTHADKDHSGGIAALLKGGYPVDEYWLPASLLVLARAASLYGGCGDQWVAGLHDRLKGCRTRAGHPGDGPPSTTDTWTSLRGVVHTDCAPMDTRVATLTDDKIREASSRLACVAADACRRLRAAKDDPDWASSRTLALRVTRTLAWTAQLLAAIAQSSARKRWFAYAGHRTNWPADCRTLCANGDELGPSWLPACSSADPGDLFTALALTQANAESLVFHHVGCHCEVLFCADSGFGWLGTAQFGLSSPAVVTAPHHGSCDRDNARVYRMVQGPCIHWVRTHHRSVRRPYCAYRAARYRYCVRCGTGQPRLVRLKCSGGQWYACTPGCTQAC
jgi:hypothetical protein